MMVGVVFAFYSVYFKDLTSGKNKHAKYSSGIFLC